MSEAEIDLDELMTQITLNLASINLEFRRIALTELKKVLNLVQPRHFVKLSAALFYFYWFSDGPEAQEADRAEIIAVADHFPEIHRLQWRRDFLHAFAELWETIDGIRVEKYLLLIKQTFTQVYTDFVGAENWKRSWTEWNGLVAEELLASPLCGLIRLSLRPRTAVHPAPNQAKIGVRGGQPRLFAVQTGLRCEFSRRSPLGRPSRPSRSSRRRCGRSWWPRSRRWACQTCFASRST